LLNLDHPNVISIVDYNIPDNDYDYPWMAFEHCQLGTLKAFLYKAHDIYKWTRKCIPETLLWQLFYDLAKAIRYCHYGQPDANGDYDSKWDAIYHRDIIPSNIFVAQYLNPQDRYHFPVFKLGDFGCAVARSELAERGLRLNYLPQVCPWDYPPEGNVASVAGDVFQVGKIMFYLISHRSPHDIGPEEMDDDFRVIPPMTIDAPRDCFHTYSAELRKLVDRCLYKYPEGRPGSKKLVELVDQDYRESPSGDVSLAPYFDRSE
jgi:NIMA (never in mitosis gene a)-related kinase